MSKKLTYEYIKDFIEGNTSFKLIDTEYIKASEKMKVFCLKCNKESNLSFTDLRQRPYCRKCNKIQLDEEYFKVIDSQEKAFWLGFIIADGFIRNNKNGESRIFGITQKDDILLKEFKSDLQFGGEIEKCKPDKGRFSQKDFYKLTINRREFVKHLINSGKTLKKDNQLSIPSSVPKCYINDFIRGFFEGDGAIYYDNTEKGFSSCISGRKDILLDIQSKINGLGHIKKSRDIYSLNFTKNQTRKLLNQLYYKGHKYGLKIEGVDF